MKKILTTLGLVVLLALGVFVATALAKGPPQTPPGHGGTPPGQDNGGGNGNGGGDNPGASHEKVTICHSTSSHTNPYVQITVNFNSIADAQTAKGHDGHNGGVFPAEPWGDIIPPYTFTDPQGTVNYPGKNWSGEGQAIYNNGCDPATPPPTTTTTTTPEPPTTTPTPPTTTPTPPTTTPEPPTTTPEPPTTTPTTPPTEPTKPVKPPVKPQEPKTTPKPPASTPSKGTKPTTAPEQAPFTL